MRGKGRSQWAPPAGRDTTVGVIVSWNKGELTAVIEPAPEGGFWAICLEIPGVNGQGESIEQAKQDLQTAIELLLEDREAAISRGLPPDAVRLPLQIG